MFPDLVEGTLLMKQPVCMLYHKSRRVSFWGFICAIFYIFFLGLFHIVGFLYLFFINKLIHLSSVALTMINEAV